MGDTEDTIEVSSGDVNPVSCESTPETGAHVIARYVKHLGAGPGVYRMMDKTGEVIYVGKARSLKNRVQNYTRLGGHTNRIAAMIRSTASMEFVNTGTEAEALLLEANLIKRFSPATMYPSGTTSPSPTSSSGVTRKRRRSPSIAGRARSKATISDPSPAPEP